MTDDLATTPAVQGLLERLGLGLLPPPRGDGPTGRNRNAAGRTTTGRAVFVKQLDARQPDAARRFRRQLAYEEAAAARPGSPASPECLGWDADELLIVFEWLEGARSGSDLASDEEFGDELARSAGEMIGALHSLPPDALPAPGTGTAEPDPILLPPLEFFDALPLAYHTQASGASLEAWGMLQRDTELAGALRRLRAEEAAAPPAFVHGDLRLDQFLLHGGRLRLCDWEEFRRADPARDVGAFVGEWLHRAVLDIPSKDAELSGPSPQLSHQDVVERGVAELNRLRTRNVAFWEGYRAATASAPAASATSSADPGLPVRATAFAGWHLIDRMFASAEQRPRLTAIDRAAAGIGRSAVLHPEKFTTVLGLEA
ncbi:class V lanthionine synthetase subunit LxmK [Streptomyces katrae]|uniref:Class V lanthionine synthetase subunit LxmK n=1 Tax=Streptomyces katrae TaxID=68223 RepID=A0ABT7GX78_9ACTN|nr:class V lanthionine synthetase subunit LxmK [Streptomyces katrae]MDK9498217.1 class V lanthionine synthetase subunit LxmK [Streptomyces katrae]